MAADQAGEWLSITEIAALRARDKGGVSRRVSKLEQEGLLRTRRGPSGTKLVHVAEYDRVVGETLDFQKELNGRPAHRNETQRAAASAPEEDAGREQARGPRPAADINFSERRDRLNDADRVLGLHLGREQTRRARAAADLAEMTLAERRGKLIDSDRVLASVATCTQAIVQTVEQWPVRADEVTAAVLKDGVAGARVIMTVLVRELLDELGRRMALIAATGSAEPEDAEEAAAPA